MSAIWPTWIRLDDLDEDSFYPPSIPHGSVDLLDDMIGLMNTLLQPASFDDARAVLERLRLLTLARAESDDEARLHFETLLREVAIVPLDILRKGCRAYAQAEGRRFFPRAPGELFAFTNRLLFQRRRRYARLKLIRRMAELVPPPASDAGPIDEAECAKLNAAMARLGVATRFNPDGTTRQSTADEREAERQAATPKEDA